MTYDQLEQLKKEVDTNGYVRFQITHPEVSILIQGYFDKFKRIDQIYKTVLEDGWIVVTTGGI